MILKDLMKKEDIWSEKEIVRVEANKTKIYKIYHLEDEFKLEIKVYFFKSKDNSPWGLSEKVHICYC